MFKVEDGIPQITRGDYGELEVVIRDSDGAEYTMQDGDFLTFSARELPEAASPLLVQIHSITNRIIFNHSDTAEVEPGRYSADIQLTTADNKRRTVWCYIPDEINKRGKVVNWENFIILPEVTIDG